MNTLFPIPASADACTSATAQPAMAALARFFGYMASGEDYTEHQNCTIHGFVLADATHGRINNSSPEREMIWVGIYGEGRWMRPEEVLELAAALKHMANAHIERVAKGHLAKLSSKPVQEGGAA